MKPWIRIGKERGLIVLFMTLRSLRINNKSFLIWLTNSLLICPWTTGLIEMNFIPNICDIKHNFSGLQDIGLNLLQGIQNCRGEKFFAPTATDVISHKFSSSISLYKPGQTV
ncbi:hypothetical protein AY600_09255 [Phormidium willei BDU 130791]|nr:hypothetical protein AY600_09255 [Phormidium willei BDU 130791]